MPLPDDIDEEKLAEVALAILYLTHHTEQKFSKAWKGMDWDLLNLLHKKGWIHNPVGKQKSIYFGENAVELAEKFLEKHFSNTDKPGT